MCNILKRVADYTKYLNFGYLVLFFAGIGIFLVVTPKAADDYWFMEYLKPWFEKQGIVNPENGGNIFNAGIPFKELWQTWTWRFNHDNIRLCNIVAAFFLLLPKCVGGSISLLAFIYSVLASFRLFKIDWKKSLLIPWTLILLYLSLPLYNHFESIVYQFNYIIGDALSVWLLLRIFCSDSEASEKRILLTFVLSIFIGVWQEAFTIPLIGCLCVKWILSPNYRKVTLSSIVGLAFGLIILFSAPGIRERMATEVVSNSPSIISGMKSILKNQWSFFVATAVLAIILLNKNTRHDGYVRQIAFPLWMFCLISVGMMAMANYNVRASWASSFFSVFLIFGLIKVLPYFKSGILAVSFKIAGALGMVLLAISLTLSSVQVFRLRPQIIAAVDELGNASEFSKIDHIEIDAKRLSSYSPLMGLLPVYDLKRNYLNLSIYYDRQSPWEYVSIIPSSFRGFKPELSASVPGEGEAMLYDDEIILPYSGPDSGTLGYLIEIDYGKGKELIPGIGSIFIQHGTTHRFIHIVPMTGWYKNHFKKIKSIGNIEKTDIRSL